MISHNRLLVAIVVVGLLTFGVIGCTTRPQPPKPVITIAAAASPTSQTYETQAQPTAHADVHPLTAADVAFGAVACKGLTARLPVGDGQDVPLDTVTDDLGWQKISAKADAVRRTFDASLARLQASGSDARTLAILRDDSDEIVMARHALDAVAAPLSTADHPDVDLLTGQSAAVRAYRLERNAYLAADLDFLHAGLPACAIPLIANVPGPGTVDADGDLIEYRITAACSPMDVLWQDEQSGSLELSKPEQVRLDTSGDRLVTVQPDRYEAVITTDLKYWIYSATCSASTHAVEVGSK